MFFTSSLRLIRSQRTSKKINRWEQRRLLKPALTYLVTRSTPTLTLTRSLFKQWFYLQSQQECCRHRWQGHWCVEVALDCVGKFRRVIIPSPTQIRISWCFVIFLLKLVFRHWTWMSWSLVNILKSGWCSSESGGTFSLVSVWFEPAL